MPRTMIHFSRREFIAAAATGVAAAPFAVAAAPITAREVVERIKRDLGLEWQPLTVDTFKGGNPDAVVRGVATTAMASVDVLRQAVAAGTNLVITCEPTFYSRAELAPAARPPSADPVQRAKADFLQRNELVLWRFSDHWRRRQPDPFAQGLAEAMAWTRYAQAGDPTRVIVPDTTLARVVSALRASLAARGGIRVVGRSNTPVRRIALLPGTTAIRAAVEAFADADLVIAGEVREWESVEYARDLVASSHPKALVLLGRVLSEDYGMKLCAGWLSTLLPDLPTRWLRAGDPYWRPA